MKAKKPTAIKPDPTLFVQVKAVNPLPCHPTRWMTLSRIGSLGGWTLGTDESELMTERQARAAIADWKSSHDDPEHPWLYRTLTIEPLGQHPRAAKPKAPARKRKRKQ
jgi:hypothetical protein